MKSLFKTISLLVLALSSLFFFRVKSPRSGLLTLPKMVAASLASYISALGFLSAGFGLLVRSPIALLAGALGGLLSLRYLRRATAQHDGFERAFGPSWQEKLLPEKSATMLPTRWAWQLPEAPAARFEQDIAFWTLPDGRKLLADVWQPPAGVQPSGLAVIYFHGSGWHLLDKDFGTRFFFRHLAAQGHVVMDVAYRLCPEVEVVGMVGDVKRAIAWMKLNASSYGVDPQRVVVAGGSAGGHLALMGAYTNGHLALTPEELQGVDTSVRGVISYYGPPDLRAYDRQAGQSLGRELKVKGPQNNRIEQLTTRMTTAVVKRMGKGETDEQIWQEMRHPLMMKNLLGGSPEEVPEQYDLASPVNHVGSHCPPTLLLQGEHDMLVPVESVRTLAQRLKASGVPVVYVEFPQTEHAFDLVILPRLSPAAQAALYDVDRFLGLVNQ